jgi:hypothetical protein
MSKMITYGPLLALNMRQRRDVTNFIEQILSWKSDSRSASEEIHSSLEDRE